MGRVLREIGTELSSLVEQCQKQWRTGGLRRIPLTLALATGAIILSSIDRGRGAALVRDCCVVDVRVPLSLTGLRLPGSMIAPALFLPLWGSLLQIIVVVGGAELLFGWRRVLAVGLFCHAVATIAPRAFLLDPRSVGAFDLTWAKVAARDTGPSAMTIGLAAFAFLRERARVLFILLAIGVSSSIVWAPQLAGYEHLVAVIAAGVVAFAWREGGGLAPLRNRALQIVMRARPPGAEISKP